jgi:menaquinone-dependent protoporphyrinogen IX oxidase
MSENKALIVYSTRYGATKSTSEEIARILQEEGFNVKVANAKEEKIKDIAEYRLVIVGSGLSMGNWGGEAEEFIKKFQGDLESRKLAIFISSLKPVEEKEGKTDLVNRIRKVGLDDKILKYHLQPISTAVFGGVIDYPKIGFLMRKGMELGYKSALKKHAFKETAPDVYDLRDWAEIDAWARDLAEKAKEHPNNLTTRGN